MDYLLGMGRSGKKFILILDIDRILSVEELMEVSRLQAETQGTEPAEVEAQE